MKKFVSLLVLGVLLVMGTIAFMWSQKMSDLKEANAHLTDQNTKLHTAKEQSAQYEAVMRAEYERCTEFVSQTSGDFREFEYCQKYLNLVSDLFSNTQ